MEHSRLLSKVTRPAGGTAWIFLDDTTAPPPPRGNRYLRIALITGKGFGAYAACAIAAGERVVNETPLVTVIAPSSTDNVCHSIQAAIFALDPARRAAFHSLSSGAASGGSLSSGIAEMMSIWKSNAYPTSEDSVRDGTKRSSACFALACRINHSCRPNAHITWNENTGRQTVHALRPIAVDEEVTVAYVEPGLSHLARGAQLAEKFGFACTCELCGLCGAERDASDTRQRRIAELATLIRSSATDAAAIGALVEERLRLLISEGQPAEWAKGNILSAVIASNGRGEREAAGRWVERGREASRKLCGKDSPEYQMYDGFHAIHLQEKAQADALAAMLTTRRAPSLARRSTRGRGGGRGRGAGGAEWRRQQV